MTYNTRGESLEKRLFSRTRLGRTLSKVWKYHRPRPRPRSPLKCHSKEARFADHGRKKCKSCGRGIWELAFKPSPSPLAANFKICRVIIESNSPRFSGQQTPYKSPRIKTDMIHRRITVRPLLYLCASICLYLSGQSALGSEQSNSVRYYTDSQLSAI